MLLSEDRIDLWRLHAKVVQKLKPEPLKTRGVSFEEVEVVADGREDIIKFRWLVLVLYLDFGEHWFLDALVCLLILYKLVADKLAKWRHPRFVLLLEQLFLVLLLVSDEVVEHVFNQLFFPWVLHQLPFDRVDDLSDSTDKQVLQNFWAQRVGRVDIFALPVKLLNDFNVKILIHWLFFGIVQVYEHVSQAKFKLSLYLFPHL